MHNAVCVNVKCHLNLRNSAWSRWKIDELELTKGLVVRRHLSLTLQHVNFNRGLHVFCGGEHFGSLGWNCRIAFDEAGHHASLGLDTETERGDVKKQHVFDISTQHTCLHRSTNCNDLIRVDGLVWLFVGHRLNEIGDGRHAG